MAETIGDELAGGATGKRPDEWAGAAAGKRPEELDGPAGCCPPAGPTRMIRAGWASGARAPPAGWDSPPILRRMRGFAPWRLP